MAGRNRPGHDVAPQELQYLFRRLPVLRQRQRDQFLPHVLRHHPVDRLAWQGAQIAAEHLDGLGAQRIERIPVLHRGMPGTRRLDSTPHKWRAIRARIAKIVSSQPGAWHYPAL
jgi:hypothetical protein